MYDDLTAQEQKEALKALLESKGWSIIQSVLNDQVKTRTDEMILKPTSEMEGGYVALEYMKGEIAGIRTVLATVQTMLDLASQQVEEEQKDLEDDEGDLDDNPNSGEFQPPEWPG